MSDFQIDFRHIQDIRNIPRISEEEQAKQFQIFRDNFGKDSKKADEAAENIIVGNLRFVLKLAIQMYREKSLSRLGTNVILMDLIQDGYRGLRKAVNITFDPEHAKFSTYAGKSIVNNMKRTFQLDRMVQIPSNHDAIVAEIYRIRSEYCDTISDEEVAKKLNVTLAYFRKIERVQKISLPISDLDSMIERGFDPQPSVGQSVNQVMASSELKEYLLKKIDSLSEKEKKIVYLKFFSDDEMTNADIGEQVNLSRQRVDAIYWSAIKKLNNKLREDDAFGNSDICQELIQRKGTVDEKEEVRKRGKKGCSNKA